MADPHLQIRGEGGTVNQTLREGGLRSPKNIFSAQFGLKIRGVGGPPEPLPWIRHWFYQEAARLSCSFLQDVKKK